MSEENTENPAQDDAEEPEVQAHSAENVLGLQKLKAEHGAAPGMVAPGSTGSCGIESCA